jgi:hypothetical protein
MREKMVWPFKKNPTRVYVFLSRSPLDWWSSSVVYDSHGNPTVRDGNPRSELRCRIYPDGSCEGSRRWKFKSGPPVDFPQELESRSLVDFPHDAFVAA